MILNSIFTITFTVYFCFIITTHFYLVEIISINLILNRVYHWIALFKTFPTFSKMLHIICRFIWNIYNLYMFKGLWFEMVWFQLRVFDHGVNQNLWSPSQGLSNDVSYVGVSEFFEISTCLGVWGLRWFSFSWGCRILVTFKICDLQVKNFPMMSQM